jgi:hypothetical protein
MYALAARSAGVAFLATVPSVAKYALPVGVAFTGLGVLTERADAKIVYTPTSVHIHNDSSFSYRLNLNHDGTVDFVLSIARVGYHGTSTCTNGGYEALEVGGYRNQPNSIEGQRGSALALHDGVKIDGSAVFGPVEQLIKHFEFEFCDGRKGVGWRGKWQHVMNRYLGFKFLINNKYHYGWARLTVMEVARGFTASLTGYAYETIPNKAIIAGKTKGKDFVTVQPASLGHLAAGASAIPAWRSGR